MAYYDDYLKRSNVTKAPKAKKVAEYYGKRIIENKQDILDALNM